MDTSWLHESFLMMLVVAKTVPRISALTYKKYHPS